MQTHYFQNKLKRLAPKSFFIAIQFCAFTAFTFSANSGELAGPPKAKETKTPTTTRLTLNQCLEMAVKNSHKLASERHKLAALEAKVGQSIWAPFSNISLNGAFTFITDKCVDSDMLDQGRIVGCDSEFNADGTISNAGSDASGDEDIWGKDWGPAFFMSLNATIPLYTFGKISNAQTAVKSAHKAQKANLPSFEHRIKFDVQRAFHAIVGAREMLYTFSQGKKHLVKARKTLEKNLENQEGEETQIDLLKLKLFESTIAHMELQTQKIEHSALAALRFLLGGKNNTTVDIIEDPQTVVEAEIAPLESYIAKAIENRPEIDALRHLAKALEAKVDMRRADFFPNLALVLKMGFGRTPGRTDVSNWLLKDSYNYGSWLPAVLLVLNYDLDFGLDKYKLDEAKAELSAVSANQQEAFKAIVLEVKTAHINATSARDSLVELEKSKRFVKGWMAAAIQNYSTGLGASKDVKDSLKEYFTVMVSMHKAIAEYNIGIANLEKATGVVSNTSEKKIKSE